MFHNSVHITQNTITVLKPFNPSGSIVTCIHLMICWVTDVKRVVQL